MLVQDGTNIPACPLYQFTIHKMLTLAAKWTGMTLMQLSQQDHPS